MGLTFSAAPLRSKGVLQKASLAVSLAGMEWKLNSGYAPGLNALSLPLLATTSLCMSMGAMSAS